MYIQILRLAVVAAALIFAVPAFAQDCGCGGSASYGGPVGYGGGGDNCGRAITQQQAEGLWAGYCNESCEYPGGGSAGRGKCKLRGRSGGGGHFGYPTGGGCGGSCGGGSCGGDCGGGSYGGGGCGTGGGCGLGSLLGSHRGGGFGGGCGSKLGGGCKLKGRHGGCGGGCKLFGGCNKFGGSAEQCGTSGAYFQEAVGYEYGTAGMQSCVSCNSCGSFDSMVAQPQSAVGSGVDSFMPMQPAMQSVQTMGEPVIGAIEGGF